MKYILGIILVLLSLFNLANAVNWPGTCIMNPLSSCSASTMVERNPTCFNGQRRIAPVINIRGGGDDQGFINGCNQPNGISLLLDAVVTDSNFATFNFNYLPSFWLPGRIVNVPINISPILSIPVSTNFELYMDRDLKFTDGITALNCDVNEGGSTSVFIYSYTPCACSVTNGGVEVCGDGIDQDCSGSDLLCVTLNPSCSTLATTYTSTATAYPQFIPFCGIGTPNPNPPTFPTQGGFTWTCGNGTTTASCTAYRSPGCLQTNGGVEICGDGIDQDCSGGDLACPVIGPNCGTASKAYTSSDTAYVGTLCAPGTANPASPSFPDIGFTSSWTCTNGGQPLTCASSRGSFPPCTAPNQCGVPGACLPPSGCDLTCGSTKTPDCANICGGTTPDANGSAPGCGTPVCLGLVANKNGKSMRLTWSMVRSFRCKY